MVDAHTVRFDNGEHVEACWGPGRFETGCEARTTSSLGLCQACRERINSRRTAASAPALIDWSAEIQGIMRDYVAAVFEVSRRVWEVLEPFVEDQVGPRDHLARSRWARDRGLAQLDARHRRRSLRGEKNRTFS